MSLESSSRTQARPGRAAFLAPCLSILCFIHCAGTAMVAPWIPAVAALAGASWLEWPLVGLSAASAAWLLRRLRASAGAWLTVAAALACTVWGLGSERETAMRAGLIVTASAQLILLVAVRRRALHEVCCGSGGVRGGCCEQKG